MGMVNFYYRISGAPSSCWCFSHELHGTSCLEIGGCIGSNRNKKTQDTGHIKRGCTATFWSWHDQKHFGSSGELLLPWNFAYCQQTSMLEFFTAVLFKNRWLLQFSGSWPWRLSWTKGLGKATSWDLARYCILHPVKSPDMCSGSSGFWEHQPFFFYQDFWRLHVCRL